MTPIGLDLSLTSTGWAVWGGDVGRIRPKKMTGLWRRRWIADEIDVTISRATGGFWADVLTVIEAPHVQFASAALPLGALHGVVLNLLDDIGTHVAYVPAAVLKQHLAGKGNANKDQMVTAAQALGYEGKSDDEADAFGLALIGHHLLGGTDHLTPMRAACLASVTWEIPLPEVPS